MEEVSPEVSNPCNVRFRNQDEMMFCVLWTNLLKVMASREKCLKRFVITLSICIFTFFEDCRMWKLQTDSQSITVENGVESNIDFFLTDYRSLNVSTWLLVQHRSSNGVFSKKCQIDHSATGVCRPASGPCECVGESSGSYRYRLRMTFTEQDGGQWVFTTGNNEEMIVNITVIPRRAFKIYTNSQSITVENGLESSINFFLNDSTAVDKGVTIHVQHQEGGLKFNTKCRIDHSRTGGCQTQFGPCECIGERSMTYQYRLRMNFTEHNGGLWKFDIVSHEGTIVNVTVIESITSLQDNQSTELSQVTGLTPPIESFTLSTTTVVILIITFIVIFIIISLVAVLRCRLRSKHVLEGEEDIEEYINCRSENVMESLSRAGQSADQSTDSGD